MSGREDGPTLTVAKSPPTRRRATRRIYAPHRVFMASAVASTRSRSSFVVDARRDELQSERRLRGIGSASRNNRCRVKGVRSLCRVCAPVAGADGFRSHSEGVCGTFFPPRARLFSQAAGARERCERLAAAARVEGRRDEWRRHVSNAVSPRGTEGGDPRSAAKW